MYIIEQNSQLILTIKLIQKALQKSGSCSLPVMGRSMEPIIKLGDTVQVISKPFENLRSGDLVAFTAYEKVLVHRIITQVDGQWITCGDNNPMIDDIPLTASNYLGYVSIPETNETKSYIAPQNQYLESLYDLSDLTFSVIAARESSLTSARMIGERMGWNVYTYHQKEEKELKKRLHEHRLSGQLIVGISAYARNGLNRLIEMDKCRVSLHFVIGATFGGCVNDGFILNLDDVCELIRLFPIGSSQLLPHHEIIFVNAAINCLRLV